MSTLMYLRVDVDVLDDVHVGGNVFLLTMWVLVLERNVDVVFDVVVFCPMFALISCILIFMLVVILMLLELLLVFVVMILV